MDSAIDYFLDIAILVDKDFKALILIISKIFKWERVESNLYIFPLVNLHLIRLFFSSSVLFSL